MIELAPEECELRGNWIAEGKRVVADEVEVRIGWLTKHKLEKITKDSSGWETLYRDPRDGRLWELTYPQSEMHGGGPRRLHVISNDEATVKYQNGTI